MFVWIVLAFFSISYNSVKSISEYKEWGTISDTQKRQKIFGDLYDFYLLIDSHTEKNAHILLYASDMMPYFVERYYLYPKIITFTSDTSELTKFIESRKFKYIALYDADIQTTDYIKIGSLPSTNKHKGILYKIK